MEWTGTSALNVALGAGVTVANRVATMAFLDEMTKPTLKRTRGRIWAQSPNPGFVYAGVIKFNDLAAAAGQLNSPLAEPEAPWIWYGILPYTTQAGFGAPIPMEIDSRTQRKIDEGESIWLTVVNPAGGFAVTLNFSIRGLFSQ